MSSSEATGEKRCACGSQFVSVIDSRPIAGSGIIPNPRLGAVVRRRHRCDVCGVRWTSYQIDVEDLEALKEVVREASIPDALAHLGVRDGHISCLKLEHADEAPDAAA